MELGYWFIRHRVRLSVVQTAADTLGCALPHRVAVLGAAGGLGQGILRVCRLEGIKFTAIVRSRPERITEVPSGSRVVVITSLADRCWTGGIE